MKLFSVVEANSVKVDKIEDCPSFGEFSKAIAELKKLTTKVRKEMKHGTKGELDDYIERRIFGRDV